MAAPILLIEPSEVPGSWQNFGAGGSQRPATSRDWEVREGRAPKPGLMLSLCRVQVQECPAGVGETNMLAR